uniref:hypothetical protein n=1 Tax=Butyrivibrio sp. TaxID=28121 RepID=UPI0025F72055
SCNYAIRSRLIVSNKVYNYKTLFRRDSKKCLFLYVYLYIFSYSNSLNDVGDNNKIDNKY